MNDPDYREKLENLGIDETNFDSDGVAPISFAPVEATFDRAFRLCVPCWAAHVLDTPFLHRYHTMRVINYTDHENFPCQCNACTEYGDPFDPGTPTAP